MRATSECYGDRVEQTVTQLNKGLDPRSQELFRRSDELLSESKKIIRQANKAQRDVALALVVTRVAPNSPLMRLVRNRPRMTDSLRREIIKPAGRASSVLV